MNGVITPRNLFGSMKKEAVNIFVLRWGKLGEGRSVKHSKAIADTMQDLTVLSFPIDLKAFRFYM